MRLLPSGMTASWGSARRSQRTARRFELVQQGEGLPGDVAEPAQALDVRGALVGGHGTDPALADFTAHSPGEAAPV